MRYFLGCCNGIPNGILVAQTGQRTNDDDEEQTMTDDDNNDDDNDIRHFFLREQAINLRLYEEIFVNQFSEGGKTTALN